MRPAFLDRYYFSRLKTDVKAWQQKGWLGEEGANHILLASQPRQNPFSFSKILGVLGAILLGFAALSFVGANWQEMSKLSRVLLLFTLMGAAFGVGWFMEQKHKNSLQEAFYLLGGLLFGVNIALIAQIYHIDRHPPDGVMLWAAGMLLVAAALENRAALLLSFPILVIWTVMESNFLSSPGGSSGAHWGFLLFWGFATFLTVKKEDGFGFHLSILSFGFWLVMSLFLVTRYYPMPALMALSAITLIMVLAALLALVLQDEKQTIVVNKLPDMVLHYAIFFMTLIPLFTQIVAGKRLFRYETFGSYFTMPSYFFIGFVLLLFASLLWLLHFHWKAQKLKPLNLAFFALISLWCVTLLLASSFEMRHLIDFLAHPVLFRIFMLAIALWLVNFGLAQESKKIVNLGLVIFGIEVLYIYTKLFGTLMDTSLFFLIGGIVLMGLAFGLEKMRRLLSGQSVLGEGE